MSILGRKVCHSQVKKYDVNETSTKLTKKKKKKKKIENPKGPGRGGDYLNIFLPSGQQFIWKPSLKGSILGLYMGVWAEPDRLSRFMSSFFN